MKIEIKNTLGNVIYSTEAKSLRAALEEAVKESANLEGAYLEGAYLRGAYLRGAYLRGVYLEGSNLQGANLRGANLQGSDLQGADLGGAHLEGADLAGADIGGAYLEGAYLRGAYLRGAYLRGVYLEIPTISNIHQAVQKATETEGALNMGEWHCGTSHCRAGWVVHLAGEAGYELEAKTSTATAAYLIYRKSSDVPCALDFYTSNSEALKEINRMAEIERAQVSK